MAFQPIDELVVEIKSRSMNVSPEIDALSKSLGELKRVARGGAGLTSVTNQFNRFAEAMGKLTDPSGKIKRLVDALQPLGTIGKSNLGTALNQLKKIPDITNALDNQKLTEFAAKIKQVTAAVKPLADEMNKVSMGFSRLPNNIQKAINANARLTRSNRSTAFGFNMLAGKVAIYAVALRRIGSVLGSWIRESTSYVENLNLFTASMGEYAQEAQRYAEHVGDLLGIDPSSWMRNQGVFNTLISGFGVAADKAALMSKNLTQLGYDLSSFYNITVSDAMQKVRSGISGELEPLRRLGFDLSKAKLQAIALAHGIEKTFNEMTQAEKSQLRYYAVMTQVTVAQGDMARTLEAPANQLRILSAQATQAARALGNIFIPALNAVLPYAIAFLKVVRWVADELARLFGFSLPEIDYSGIERVAGGAEDLADGMNDAASAAEKLRRTIFGFDQLNLMAGPQTTGGAGASSLGYDLGLPLPEYDFLGGLIESRTSAIFKSWQESVEPVLNFIVDNFETIKTLALVIGGILLTWKVGSGVVNFVSTLSKLPLGLGGAGLVIGGGAGLAATISNVISEGLNGINFAGLIGSSGAFTAGAAMLGKLFGSTLIGGATGGVIGGLALFITGIYDAIKNGIDWLSAALIPVGSTAAGAAIGAIIGSLGGPIGAGIGALIGLAVGLITDLVIWIVQNWEEVKRVFNTVVTWIDTNVIQPIGNFFSGLVESISNVLRPFAEWFGKLFEGIWLIVCAVWKVASTWFQNNVITPLVNKFNDVKDKVIAAFRVAYDWIKTIFSPLIRFFNTYIIEPLKSAFATAWNFIAERAEKVFEGIKNIVKGAFNGIVSVIETVVNSIIRAINWFVGSFNTVAKWAAGVLGTNYSGLKPIGEISIARAYATGGFPVPGELFLAREAGPELVGRVGGRTAVMNNDQLVEAVAKGVADYIGKVKSEGGDIHIYIDGVLAKSLSAIDRKNTRAGRTVIPVGV